MARSKKNSKVTQKKNRTVKNASVLNNQSKVNGQLTANRKYKDTVFRMLFSDKTNLMSLYNAVKKTTNAVEKAENIVERTVHNDPGELEIVTLDGAVYMGMKNDLAFIIDMNLFLYEHQSTYNPNIPLREYAQYVQKVRKYTKEMELDAAVERAVNECIQEGILEEFLRKNRSEVIAVSIFEYDKDEEEKKLRKAEYEAGKLEGIEEGIIKGKKEGIKEEKTEMIREMLKAGETVEKIARYARCTIGEVEKIKNSR